MRYSFFYLASSFAGKPDYVGADFIVSEFAAARQASRGFYRASTSDIYKSIGNRDSLLQPFQKKRKKKEFTKRRLSVVGDRRTARSLFNIRAKYGGRIIRRAGYKYRSTDDIN